jgi:hypothetical protein
MNVGVTSEQAAVMLLSLPVAGLATARLTRLIVADQITAPLRSAAWRVDPHMWHVGYLVSCPHCTGIWAALAVWLTLSAAYAQDYAGVGWLIITPVMTLAIAQLGYLLRGGEDSSAMSAMSSSSSFIVAGTPTGDSRDTDFDGAKW